MVIKANYSFKGATNTYIFGDFANRSLLKLNHKYCWFNANYFVSFYRNLLRSFLSVGFPLSLFPLYYIVGHCWSCTTCYSSHLYSCQHGSLSGKLAIIGRAAGGPHLWDRPLLPPSAPGLSQPPPALLPAPPAPLQPPGATGCCWLPAHHCTEPPNPAPALLNLSATTEPKWIPEQPNFYPDAQHE